MTPKEINRSIETKNVQFTKGERIEHWLNFVLLLIPLSLMGFLVIDTANQNEAFPFFGLILVGFFVLLLRHKLISPKLKAYKSNLTAEQFQMANHAAAKLNGWLVYSITENYFSAVKDGIRITAILKDGKLYLNSMVNPVVRTLAFFGPIKKKKFELLDQYRLILKGNDVIELANQKIVQQEEDFWKESEWTVKNTIKRILGYGLSILFIALGVFFILEGNIQEVLCGFLMIIFSLTYIFLDVKVILEKYKKQKAKL